MKKLLFFIFFFTTFFVFSQKTVFGKVTDSLGNGISKAHVMIESFDSSIILASSITDTQGSYRITFQTDFSRIKIKVRTSDEKKEVKEINNQDQIVNFNFSSKITEIKSIELKRDPITRKGDTISYHIKSFVNKNDRVLADALRKIPGIEVNSEGAILYQGKAINKFYVDGQDLMDGSYGTINNSLPLDAIGKLEVLENHQPIEVLRSKVPSDKAAINIQLKKEVTMTGRGEVGLGLSPFLRNIKLTPMLFTDNVQWVLNYKTSNTGEAVESEANRLSFGGHYEGVSKTISPNGWLNIDQGSVPNLSQKRYLMNNVHYLSGNLLTHLDKHKEWKLKFNASYINNNVARDSYDEIQYVPEFNKGAQVTNTIKNNFHTDKIKGEISFSRDVKKSFFKNTTTFSQFWNTHQGEVERRVNENKNSVVTQAGESLKSPTVSFQNSLSTLIPWKEKLINIRSLISYQNDQQSLKIDPIHFTDQPSFDSLGRPLSIPLFPYSAQARIVEQYMRMQTFEKSNAVNVSFSIKKWTLTPEVGISHTANKLSTALYGLGDNGYIENYGDRYGNQLQFTSTVPTVSAQINYRGIHFNMYTILPIHFNHLKALDPSRNIAIQLRKSVFEPSVFLQYEFASFWKASVSGNISYQFGAINSVYGGYILQTPSSLTTSAAGDILSQSKNYSSDVHLEYRNPSNNLFLSLRGNIVNTRNNLMTSTMYNGANLILTYVVRNNDINSHSQGVEIGKYFAKFKTKASIGLTGNSSEFQSLNNTMIQESKNNNNNFSFRFNTSYFSWMSLDYVLGYGIGKNSYTYQGNDFSIKSERWSHYFNLLVYPFKDHSIGLTWDQSNSSQGKQNFQNSFYDMTYQYSWSKKKVDFEVKWLNIGNTKVYEQIGNSSLGMAYKRMYIRPSQVLFSVKFNFK